jgi:hypothetical protein
MKRCNDKDCDEPLKSIYDFHKKKGNKDGHRNQCKICVLRRKKEYDSNPDNIKKRIEYDKKRRSTPEYKIKLKEYLNDPKVKDRMRETSRLHGLKPETKIKRNQKRNKRRTIDSKFKISTDISMNIKNSLKCGKNGKSWISLVDFTLSELISHLKNCINKIPGVTWEDYMNGELHMDHIRPISSFNYESYNDLEFKECWNLNNFQLLLSSDNISKSDQWDGTPNNISFNLNYISYNKLQSNLIKG